MRCGGVILARLHLTKFVTQGENENRTIEESLRIGWELLAMLPRVELKRVRDKWVEKYHPSKG